MTVKKSAYFTWPFSLCFHQAKICIWHICLLAVLLVVRVGSLTDLCDSCWPVDADISTGQQAHLQKQLGTSHCVGLTIGNSQEDINTLFTVVSCWAINKPDARSLDGQLLCGKVRLVTFLSCWWFLMAWSNSPVNSRERVLLQVLLKIQVWQMGLHKIKKLLHKKEMVSKLKRPPTDWEKIFASYTSDKGLTPEYTRSSKN
jgi:hypothetical protein